MEEILTGAPGFTLPGIENLQRIGRGGFASVYRGWQPAFHRDVAVKILDPTSDQLSEPRFQREIQAMGSLSNHPNVVPVYEAGVVEDRPYLVMPLLTGGSLADQLVEGPLPPTEVIRLGVAMADALGAAHRLGVLHRDVKPANILSTAYGQPQLSDFGIARFADSTITQGQIAATISYAAPEVLAGAAASPASDIYSLGATLYTALRGEPPFTMRPGEPPVGFAMRIMGEAPPDLGGASVPGPLAAVIQRAMAKDPTWRYPSAEAFVNALQSIEPAGEAGVALGSPETTVLAPLPASPPLAGMSPRLDTPTFRSGPGRERAAPYPDRPFAHLGRAPLVAAVVILVLGIATVVALMGRTSRSTTASQPSAPTTAAVAPPARATTPTTPPASKSDPVQATKTYYDIINQHRLEEAFHLLSPAYQLRTGYGSYQGFWNTIARVDVLTVTSANDTATATLRYTRTDGTTSTETARLRFVPDPGTGRLLIDGYAT